MISTGNTELYHACTSKSNFLFPSLIFFSGWFWHWVLSAWCWWSIISVETTLGYCQLWLWGDIFISSQCLCSKKDFCQSQKERVLFSISLCIQNISWPKTLTIVISFQCSTKFCISSGYNSINDGCNVLHLVIGSNTNLFMSRQLFFL